MPRSSADLGSVATAAFPGCVPTLTDGILTLRAHRPEDAERIVEQCTDPASMAWLPLPRPYGLEQADEYLHRVRTGWEDPEGRREWAIADGDGRYLGSICVFDRSAQRCELGFALHPDARGGGMMARAVRLVIGWATGQGIRVVRWHAAVGNWASRRVAWACGFTDPVLVPDATLDDDGHPRDGWAAVWHAGQPLAPAHPWAEPATLASERVVLRPFADDDGAALPETLDPESACFMAPVLPVRQGYAAWLARRREQHATARSLHWAIVVAASGELAGGIQLALPGPQQGTGIGVVGFWVLPSRRGAGLAGAALALVLDHALAAADAGGLGLTGVRARADVDNIASLRTLWGAGFRHIGSERAAYPHEPGAPTDAWVFDVLATDERLAQRVTPWPVPVVQTARARLRPWTAADAPDPADDPDEAARRFMPAAAQPSHADFPAWLARRRRLAASGQVLDWCLADRATDRMLGHITLFTRQDGPLEFQAELGYFVLPSARGRGLLAEVLPHVVAHCFRPRADGGLGLARLHAATDLDNDRSRAVLRRLGMRQWGTDRQAWRRQDGTLCDGAYYELLAADPR